MSSRILAAIALAAAGAAVAIGPPGGLSGHASADAGSPVTYRTLFQDPGVPPVLDYSLEDHARALIAATPAGERITFAFRDFNRLPVTTALLAAAARKVQVDGVIDGGERNRAAVKALVAGLGAEHAVVCGSPGTFNSCIADSLKPSLQHNKFLTFSRLEDGRQHVILETSENFFEPSQYGYYNDMVEIAGDHALYDGYSTDVTLRVAASDGHRVGQSGLQRLHVELSGAQSGPWDFPGEANGCNVQELAVSAEGLTTVTYFAEDTQGNVEVAKTLDVRIDKTAPVLTGLPRTCELWPPDNKLVRVADVAATDPLSGIASFSLSAFSDAVSDFGDVVIANDADAHAGSVDLRAEKAAFGATRTYTLGATATDVAGNGATGAATCVVPHSQGAATK